MAPATTKTAKGEASTPFGWAAAENCQICREIEKTAGVILTVKGNGLG